MLVLGYLPKERKKMSFKIVYRNRDFITLNRLIANIIPPTAAATISVEAAANTMYSHGPVELLLGSPFEGSVKRRCSFKPVIKVFEYYMKL